MPRIPQLTPQVSSQALPQARLSLRAPDNAIGRGIQNVGQVMGQIALDEKRKADSLAVTEADRRLSEWETVNLYAQGGALSQKGKDAFGLPESVLPDFDTVVGDITSGLSSDDQKLAFQRMAQARRGEINRTLHRHISREREVYDQNETDAYLANSLEAAANNYTNPERVATELNRQEGVILAWADRNGVSGEVVKSRLDGMTSKTHAAVIDRMLTDGEYKGAEEYFIANREDIQSEDAAAAEKLIRAQTLRGEAQAHADAIITNTENLGDALKQARTIEDPELRDSVTERVKSRFTEAKAIEAEQDRQAKEQAFATVEETGSVDAIPVSVWDGLDSDTKRSLEIRSRQVRSGIEPVTDWETYYELKSQAAESPKEFAERDLLKHRPELSDSEFKELAGVQTAMKAGRGKSDTVLQGYRTANQIVNDTLDSVGIDASADPGSDDAKRVAEFKRTVDAQIIALQTQTGKEATTEDVQRIVDQLVIRGEVIGGGLLHDPDKFRFEVAPGETFRVTDIDDVPQDERQKIEEALRRRNMNITESAILTLFNAKVGQ